EHDRAEAETSDREPHRVVGAHELVERSTNGHRLVAGCTDDVIRVATERPARCGHVNLRTRKFTRRARRYAARRSSRFLRAGPKGAITRIVIIAAISASGEEPAWESGGSSIAKPRCMASVAVAMIPIPVRHHVN